VSARTVHPFSLSAHKRSELPVGCGDLIQENIISVNVEIKRISLLIKVLFPGTSGGERGPTGEVAKQQSLACDGRSFGQVVRAVTPLAQRSCNNRNAL
jgi:hypothetical protein